MIPLSFLLIPYGLFLLLFLIFAFFNIYHVFRFGFGELPLFFVTFVFMALSVLIIFISFQQISQIDLTEPLINLGQFGSSEIPTFNLR